MMYMMKPNDIKGYKSVNGQAGQRKKKQSNRSKFANLPWKIMISSLLVMTLMAILWLEAKSKEEKPLTADAANDLNLIYNWSDRLLLNGAMKAEWSFRWDVTVLNGTMEQLADQLFLSGKGEYLARNIRSNGEVIEGAWILPESRLQVTRTESDKIAEKLTITLQVDSGYLKNANELKRSVEQLHKMVAERDNKAQMNVKVFGEANDREAINEIKRMSVAQTVDEYYDPGTTAVTMFSNQVKQYRWINSEKMANIQVAEHKDMRDGNETITIGIPLISGEFGSTQSIALYYNN